jgi:hypothetical protein
LNNEDLAGFFDFLQTNDARKYINEALDLAHSICERMFTHDTQSVFRKIKDYGYKTEIKYETTIFQQNLTQ